MTVAPLAVVPCTPVSVRLSPGSSAVSLARTLMLIDPSSLVEPLSATRVGPLSVTDTVTVAVEAAVTPWLSDTV